MTKAIEELIEEVAVSNLNKDKYIPQIENAIDEVCRELEISSTCVSINDRKGKKGQFLGYVVQIFEEDYPLPKGAVSRGTNSPALMFIAEETGKYEGMVRISIRPDTYAEFNLPTDATEPIGKDLISFRLPFGTDTLKDYTKKVILKSIKEYESTSKFGCCSRFEECSNAKKCLHPNYMYATGCAYRKNLESGHIFY